MAMVTASSYFKIVAVGFLSSEHILSSV